MAKKRKATRKKRTTRRRATAARPRSTPLRVFGAAQIKAALRRRPGSTSTPWPSAAESSALRLAVLKKLSKGVGRGKKGTVVVSSNRPRHRRKRGGTMLVVVSRRRRRKNRPGRKFSGRRYRPVRRRGRKSHRIVYRRRPGKAGRRWRRSAFRRSPRRRLAFNPPRRGHRRYKRNPGRILSYFNPFGLAKLGGIGGKITSTAKQVLSVDNAKKGAAVVATIALAWGLPSRFLPQYDTGGVKSLALSAAAGVAATVAAGMVAPALVPAMVIGTGAAVLLKAALLYARGWLFPSLQGMGAFLTQSQAQGAGLLGDFMTTRGTQQYAAIGPVASAALGGGERFSPFS